MRNLLFGVSAYLLTNLAALSAEATLFFTDESAFLNAAGAASVPINTTGFESFPLGLIDIPFTIDGVTVISSNNKLVISQPTSDGERALLGFTGSLQEITFVFSEPIHAFALDIINFGAGGPATLTMTTSNDSSDLFSGFTGPDANILFGGVVDSIPFTRMDLVSSQNGNTVLFDRIQSDGVSAVPEPGTVAVLGVGLAGLAWLRRRRAL